MISKSLRWWCWWVGILLCWSTLLSPGSGHALHRGRGEEWWLSPPQPYFSTNTPTNVTVISGHTAYLPCRVHMLGERSVTWMRGRDLHILTAGIFTYSADDRFQVLHAHETEDWTLQVMLTQPSDSGTYKCQVNSEPKIFRDVYLTVMDKRRLDNSIYKPNTANPDRGEYGTRLVGAASRYLQAGSTLVLECVVSHTKEPPPALLWYHQSSLLDYDSPRGGIAITVEKTGGQTTSRLRLSSVQQSDSGNYTCVPVEAPSSSVSVHVTTDELQAAVQLGSYGAAHCLSSESALCIVILAVYNLLRTFPVS